jgi:hypothetical protein
VFISSAENGYVLKSVAYIQSTRAMDWFYAPSYKNQYGWPDATKSVFRGLSIICTKPIFMLRNYFKIAFRNMARHKAYSGINILGLAIGIAACLLILQYVSFELSFEDFHIKKDRIFRVRQDRYIEGN